MGGCISLFNAFYLIQEQNRYIVSQSKGTLGEYKQTCRTWLLTHPRAKEGSVHRLSLPLHHSHKLANGYFPLGCFGSIFCFKIRGGNLDKEMERGSIFIQCQPQAVFTFNKFWGYFHSYYLPCANNNTSPA